jgi:hypothetical protein
MRGGHSRFPYFQSIEQANSSGSLNIYTPCIQFVTLSSRQKKIKFPLKEQRVLDRNSLPKSMVSQ